MLFMDAAGVRRIESYLARIGEVLGNAKRRASFAVYAMGLFGSAERKSVEPMAALVCRNPKKMDAAHQRLLHFVSSAPWDDRAVRRVAAHYAVDAKVEREPVEAWIVDDTGFLKQGTRSVGVQRQYTGVGGDGERGIATAPHRGGVRERQGRGRPRPPRGAPGAVGITT